MPPLQQVVLVIALVFGFMLAEQRLSRANERRLRAAGAIEPPGDPYRALAILYPAAFLVMGLEGAWRATLQVSSEFSVLSSKFSKGASMARLQTEYEVTCPCCRATLVVDEGLRRVVRHVEPERADKPKLDEAHRILDEERARRDSLFEQSVQSERTRGDALSKRFEEALKQARQEPVTKPSRDFDLD